MTKAAIEAEIGRGTLTGTGALTGKENGTGIGKETEIVRGTIELGRWTGLEKEIERGPKMGAGNPVATKNEIKQASETVTGIVDGTATGLTERTLERAGRGVRRNNRRRLLCLQVPRLLHRCL